MAEVVEAEFVDGRIEWVAETEQGGEISGVLTRNMTGAVLTDEAMEQITDQIVGVEVKGLWKLNGDELEVLREGRLECHSPDFIV